MTDVYADELLTKKDIVATPLEVIRMGHPTLKLKAKEVADPTDAKIQQIVANMMATINKIGVDHVAGLAAPQVNVSLRIFLYQEPERHDDGTKQSSPFTVVINPKIEPIGDEKEVGWEACLSVPGLMGAVPRYKHIKYTYQNLEGKWITREAHDFHARVIQHETDHLDGFIYIERIQDMKLLSFDEEFQEFVVKPAQKK